MTAWQNFAAHVAIVSLLIITPLHSQSTYVCDAGSDCFVDCENIANFDCNANGSLVVINAEAARTLTVTCHLPNACQNMMIECPISSYSHSACAINCDLDYSCKDMEIHTHNATQMYLACAAQESDRSYATDVVCSNITIDGVYLDKEDRPPEQQTITIECNDEEEAPNDTPTCQRIRTKNLGQMSGGAIPKSNVTLNLLCTVNWAAPEEISVCSELSMDGGKSKFFNLYLEGDLYNSSIVLNDTTEQVNIQLVAQGTIWKSLIKASEVQKRFLLSVNSEVGVLESTIIGPYRQAHTNVEIAVEIRSVFQDSSFEGRFNIYGDGVYERSTFNAKTAGYVSIEIGSDGTWNQNKLIIEDSNASLVFYGHASGYIDAVRSAYLSILCQADDPETSCNGLVIDAPPYVLKPNTSVIKHRAFLACVDYGCTNITTRSPNGAEDIAVTAVLCQCEYGGNGESGDSCIGVINVECGDERAVFDGITCTGYTECCGGLVAETKDAVCSKDVSGSSGLSDGDVAGVVIGIILFLLLFTSLACYCHNQQKIKHQFKRAQDTNPYTQALPEDSVDAANVKTGANGGGYGATGNQADGI